VAVAVRGADMALRALADVPLVPAIQVFFPEDTTACHRRAFDAPPPSSPSCTVQRGTKLTCK
jgi:hypothetical protein